MKKTSLALGLLSVAAFLALTACSTFHKSSASALQGAWNGREPGIDPATPRALVFSGNKMEYHGAVPNDWGKGTFTLRDNTNPKQIVVALTECGIPQYVGKTCYLIYKIENGELTATANEPGVLEPPASFDAPHARRMIFQKD